MIQGCRKSGKLGKMSIFDQKQGKPGKVRAKSGEIFKNGFSSSSFLIIFSYSVKKLYQTYYVQF